MTATNVEDPVFPTRETIATWSSMHYVIHVWALVIYGVDGK
jgi:hypothetical protein